MRSPIGVLLNQASPIVYSSGGSLSIPLGNRSDAEAMMKQYGSVGTLFAIVHRISNSVAACDWHLYRRNRDNRRRYGPVEDNRVEVVAHAALDLWNKPNPFYTRQEFVESFQQHLDLTGEGWWVTDRTATLPLTMWIARPDRMAPVPHKTKFLSGYIYTGPDGQKVPLELNEVIQLRMPNPLDPYRGLGPVQALLTDLDSNRYSAEWNRNFFMNSAEPGGIIEVEKALDDKEFKQLRERWAEQHRGIANAHRVALLEQGKWKDRAFSMRDIQFAQLREVSRDIIREAFGFPKSMLGVSDDVNRAVAEAQEVVFARWLVVPRLERIKGALNNDLLGMYGGGENLEFDYDNPVPEDRVAEVDELVKRIEAAMVLIVGKVEPKAAWELVGLPDLPMKKPEPVPPGLGGPPVPSEEEPAEEEPEEVRAATGTSLPIGSADAWGRVAELAFAALSMPNGDRDAVRP